MWWRTDADGKGESKPSGRDVLLRLGGSVAVLGLLALFLPLHRLVEALGRMPAWAWAGAIAGYLCLHLLGTAKWRMLINAAGARVGYADAVRCYYAGLFGNTLLPSVVGGDVIKAGLAIRVDGTRDGIIFGSVLDRGLDLVALITVAVAGAVMVPRSLGPSARRIYLALGALLALLALIGTVGVAATPVSRLPYRLRRVLVNVRRIARTMYRKPGYALAALAVGLLLQSLLISLQAWLGEACGLDVPLHVWFFTWPTAKVSALLPLTQGGIGVREAALVGLFAPFGAPAALVVAAGLAFQAVVIGGGLTGGLIAAVIGGARPSRLLNRISESRIGSP